jgi:hypothetical protein
LSIAPAPGARHNPARTSGFLLYSFSFDIFGTVPRNHLQRFTSITFCYGVAVMEKRHWKALGKVAGGLYEVVSGTLTAAGQGFLGARLRRHNMMHAARRYGTNSFMQGKKTLAEGWNELKN